MRRRWEACSGTRATAPAPGRALRDHSGQARTRRCVGRPKRAHAPLQPRRPSPHTSPHATRVWVPPRPHWIVRLGLRLDGHGGVPQAVEIGLTLPCTVEGSDRHRPENVQYGFSHRDAGRALLRAESSAVANVTATRPQTRFSADRWRVRVESSWAACCLCSTVHVHKGTRHGTRELL
jgi:hypothetical protein